MPFLDYRDFDDCVARNSDKANPEAYCATLERSVKGTAEAGAVRDTMPAVRLQIVPVFDEPFVAGGDPAIIVDVDGTLLSRDNEPFADRIAAINGMRGRVFVVTGRIEDERDSTERALADGGLEGFTLRMRPNTDVDVVEYKKAEAARLLETYDVVAAYDNDSDALAAYSELGIDAMRPGTLAEVADEADDEADNMDDEIDDDMGNKKRKRRQGMATDALDDDPEDMGPTGEVLEPQGNEDFHALLVVEGVWTGDGRYIDEGALDWRNLPLPLMATDRTTEGHMDAVLVGNLTRVERDGREVHAWGNFVASEDPATINLQSLIRNGDLRGVSVDLDSVEYEVLMPMPEMEEPEDMEPDDEGNMVFPGDMTRMRITGARIMGATVVPFPAFQEAFIESTPALTASLLATRLVSGWIQQFASYDDIDFVPPQGAREEAELGLKWREEHGRGGTAVGVARARDISNGKQLSPDTVTRMVSYFARHEVDKQGKGWSPDEDGFPSAGRIAWALWGGDPGRVWAEKVRAQMERRDGEGSIVASGHPIVAPVVPPAAWFADPQLSGPTPLTVDDNGRVFGHLAVWGQCHIGHTNRCVEPPASMANYAHFLTGEMLCDDGTRFAVGQITMNGNHAPHSYNAEQTAAHYDNTATAVADVTAGEDAYGIWVAGALRPELSPAHIRGLMASDVSGDWRRIGGNLELVAVLAVNVPGFPKVRVREAQGLVASLSIPAYQHGDAAEYIDALAASIGRSADDRKRELVHRVHGERIAALVARVRGSK